MIHPTTYRKGLAALTLFLVFVVDLAAMYHLFPPVQTTLFGAILGVQTLLIIAFHQRCLETEGCMEKSGYGINLFYAIFATIGLLSLMVIMLYSELKQYINYLQAGAAIAYATLLVTGIPTAFKAIIGVKHFSGGDKPENDDTPPADDSIIEVDDAANDAEIQQQKGKEDAQKREQDTLNKWKAEKKAANL